MEAKVGKYKVVHTQSLIIPEGQEGWISFTIEGWNAKFKLVFEKDDTTQGKSTVVVTPIEDYGIIRFINWENKFGTALTTPMQVANLSSGSKMFVSCCHWFIGSKVHRIDVQFLMEEHQ